MKLYCYKIVDVYGDFYMVRNTVLFDVLQYFLIARMFGGPAKAYRLTDRGIRTLAPSRSILIPTKPRKATNAWRSWALGTGISVSVVARVSTLHNSPIVPNATAILSFQIIIMVYVGWLILMYWRSQVEYRNLITQHLIETDVAPRAVKKRIKRIRVLEAVKIAADNGTTSIVGLFMAHLLLDFLYFGAFIITRFIIFTSRLTLAVYLVTILCLGTVMVMRWMYTSMTKHPIRI
ncbi:MAG: hypothetical protein LKJ69_04820 [Lactobacillus sp.]|jgi:hypothetical protein|nr:hypothetical protein [Lactobacillus sp.]MCI2032706.1 hypothetical protein [Lactobacillus sp.]